MQFVDYAKIHVKAGDGGRGCVSFRREKYIPRGGPNGGDGGRGGHVVIKATSKFNTLLDQKYKREYKADRGQHGMGKKMHGKNGEDLIISVPVGTVIREVDQEEMIADLDADGSYYIAARGGRGGLRNAHFATPVRKAPRFAQPGESGEERWLIFELKLLADVGLIGLPNAGKSRLISVMAVEDPVDNYRKINRELALYSPSLINKYQAVVAAKLDIADKKRLDRLRRYCKTNGIDFFEISAVAGKGIKELLAYLSVKVEEKRKGTV